jgi:geranylgeranylglycerol-phosphate geranylgeranyltransferase
MLRGYFRLGRPVNALAGCLAVLISGYVGQTTQWLPVALAAAAVLLITVSTNAWNDYLDIEIDRINKPDRPLPSGQISPRGALLFSAVCSVLSLAIASFVGLPALIIALGSNTLLYLYSWRLKCTVLWGNVAVAAIVALGFIFGGVAAGNIYPVLSLALSAFFAILAREILKTMADYHGDKQQNCRTIATAWGLTAARRFLILFLGIAALAMLAAYFTEGYASVYLYIVIFVIYPVLASVGVHSKSASPGEALEGLSTAMKYLFFIWFLAVILGVALPA